MKKNQMSTTAKKSNDEGAALSQFFASLQGVAIIVDDNAKSADYNTWDIPQVGTGYLAVQMKEGPFSMKAGKDGKLMRQALAHAIDKEGIHQAVFNGLSEKLTGFYSSSSPWYMEDIANAKEYDPEKSRHILRKLKAEGQPIAVVARASYQYMRNTAEIVHAMLSDAGFKPTNDLPKYSYMAGDNGYGTCVCACVELRAAVLSIIGM